jgi:hypothetical protein
VVNTDDPSFDGTGYEVETELVTEAEPKHGFPQSLNLRLPPLSALVFEPVAEAKAKVPKPKKVAVKKAPTTKAPAKKARATEARPKRKVASTKA